MAQVVHLATHERPELDDSAVTELRQMMGESRFQEVVEESAFQLIEKLCQIEKAVNARAFEDVFRLSKRVSLMSIQVGMEDFAHVAEDLQACSETGDLVAIEAVAARLSRVGEASLFSVLQLADSLPA